MTQGVTFVDLGAFDGRSVRAYELEYKVHFAWLWEPNPMVNIKKPVCNYKVLQAAAWTSDGRAKILLGCPNNRFGSGQGSTLLHEKTTGWLDRSNPVEVQTWDLATWLKQKRSQDMVVKMNIEGAEYPVLEHLANQHALDVPREWHISWHGEKVGRTEKDAAHLRWYLRYAGYQQQEPLECFPETFERWAR